jgi:hypothetical protein
LCKLLTCQGQRCACSGCPHCLARSLAFFATLQTQALEDKLAALRSGAVLISAEDVAKVERHFTRMVEGWAKHKRIFMAIWNQVSENLEGKQVGMGGDRWRVGLQDVLEEREGGTAMLG